MAALGKAMVSVFLKIYTKTGEEFIYILVGSLIGLFVVYAYFSMKDVINSKEFDVRRSRSDTQDGKKRVSYIIKQGAKRVIEEP